MVLYAVVVVALTWLLGAVLLQTKDSLGPLAGLILLPAMVIPLVMAYLAHNFSGATGNPFKGLTWGNTSWYFLAWIVALLAAAVALVISVGLGLNQLDLGMSGYVAKIAEQSAQGGNQVPPEAMGFLKISGYVTVFFAPTLGAWIGGAMGSLMTFPWLGWFYRRAMVFGRDKATALLLVLFALTGIVGGIADNPMWSDTPVWMRMVLMGAAGLAYVPGMVWIFLKTRSAVIPALAMYSYQNGLSAAMPFLSIESPLLAPPFGLVGSIVALAAGIGLWVWKDPGGMELAVAAVAHDGTPLTPEQVRRMDEAEAAPEAGLVRGGLEPPPPTPGEIEGLPPGDDRPDRSNIESGGDDGQ